MECSIAWILGVSNWYTCPMSDESETNSGERPCLEEVTDQRVREVVVDAVVQMWGEEVVTEAGIDPKNFRLQELNEGILLMLLGNEKVETMPPQGGRYCEVRRVENGKLYEGVRFGVEVGDIAGYYWVGVRKIDREGRNYSGDVWRLSGDDGMFNHACSYGDGILVRADKGERVVVIGMNMPKLDVERMKDSRYFASGRDVVGPFSCQAIIFTVEAEG